MIEPVARVVLIAGPSGSGKSYVARRTGLPVLCLDDFYKDGDDPSLPRHGTSIDDQSSYIDWDSIDAWDTEGAVRTIGALAHEGKAEVPIYSIHDDRRTGSRVLDLAGGRLFVAEGIFAADIVGRCADLGLLAGAYALRRHRLVNFGRRLTRDLTERRKAPSLLVRRGVDLWKDEPRVLARHRSLGCEPGGARQILARVAAL